MKKIARKARITCKNEKEHIRTKKPKRNKFKMMKYVSKEQKIFRI